MKPRVLFVLFSVIITFLLQSAVVTASQPQLIDAADGTTAIGSEFSYQGMLSDSDGVVTKSCDFKFTLYSAPSGGNKVGSDLFRYDVQVFKGAFTTTLDFGKVFSGNPSWIETAVRCPAGSGNYITLTPRQSLYPVPYALYAATVGTIEKSENDFTTGGYLISARGVSNDASAGTLQLVNTISGKKWHITILRDSNKLNFGMIDQSGWHDAATLDASGSLTVTGNLYVTGKLKSDVSTTGALRSSRGLINDPLAGLLVLENAFTNNRWQIATTRDQDNIEYWYGENGTVWKQALTVDKTGDLLVHGDALVMVDVDEASGLQWNSSRAALGRAKGAGDWSRDAQAGDLILRADNGHRILLAQGSETPDHPAALTVEVSGTVSIPSLQGQGYIEANLQTEAELAAPRIERFSQGDVLCWSESAAQLELCASAASPMVAAIADTNGKPMILGVEPVKVTGIVHAGDLLVASAKPGYATAWSQINASSAPAQGLVIAKAFSSSLGGETLIKAMIMNR